MIISFLYSNFITSDKSSNPDNFDWPNFISLAWISYMLYYLLYNKAISLEFT